MEIASYEEVGREAWDAFCLESDDAWFLHTALWLEYTLAYRPDAQGQNQSFAVVDRGLILAVCPLIIERAGEEGSDFSELAFAGEPCPVPALKNGLGAKNRTKVTDLVFAQIDEIAFASEIGRCSLRFNSLTKSYGGYGTVSFNHLVRFGYLDYSLYTQVLDLADDEDTILRSMRKGHKYSVKQARSECAIEVFDRESITPEVFAAYGVLHAKASGRKTRNQSTFDLMFEWVKEGDAVLCGARVGADFIGFALAFVYKDGSLYASACNDPDAEEKSIGHGIQWALICHLKERKIRRYDMGLQFWSPQLPYTPDRKAVEISLFKRGFGGTTVPVFCGEKYYDVDLFRRVHSDRIAAYCRSQFAAVEGV